MITNFLVLNPKAKLVFRHDLRFTSTKLFFKDSLDSKYFSQMLLDSPEPHFRVDKLFFLYTKYRNHFLVFGLQNVKTNWLLAYQMLYQLKEIFESFKVDFTHVGEHLDVVYNVLDEALDYGYPQITDVAVLREYRQTQKQVHKMSDHSAKKITKALTIPSCERKSQILINEKKILYRKNEVFVDVAERVSCLISSSGNVLNSEIVGVVNVRPYLSGIPYCSLGLKNTNLICDVRYHKCVGKTADVKGTVSFIPPDKEFKLMEYRVDTNVKLPFKINVVGTKGGNSTISHDVHVNLAGRFDRNLVAKNVRLVVPVPKNSVDSKDYSIVQASIGKVSLDLSKSQVVWDIKKYTGGASANLRIRLKLMATTKDTEGRKKVIAPMKMKFCIPMCSGSEVRVRYFRVVENKMKYNTFKWVKYFLEAQDYEQRM